MTPYVTFEPEGHIYTAYTPPAPKGRVIPSVTEIIADAGLSQDFTSLPHDIDWYGDRGTKIHLACHLHDQDNLDESTVHPEIMGFVESYKLGKRMLGLTVLYSELIVWDRALTFAGTLDKVVQFAGLVNTVQEGTRGLFDLKSGQPHPSHGDQTAGYSVGLDNTKPKFKYLRRFGLYLRKDGSMPKLREYAELSDYNIFQSAVNIYHAKRRKI